MDSLDQVMGLVRRFAGYRHYATKGGTHWSKKSAFILYSQYYRGQSDLFLFLPL